MPHFVHLGLRGKNLEREEKMETSRTRYALRALLLVVAVVAAGFGAVSRADAALQFVGQWQVDQGPNWMTNPPVYSGQEAAALLFGGLPADYTISTLGLNPNVVDSQAWYSIWGVGGG